MGWVQLSSLPTACLRRPELGICTRSSTWQHLIESRKHILLWALSAVRGGSVTSGRSLFLFLRRMNLSRTCRTEMVTLSSITQNKLYRGQLFSCICFIMYLLSELQHLLFAWGGFRPPNASPRCVTSCLAELAAPFLKWDETCFSVEVGNYFLPVIHLDVCLLMTSEFVIGDV